MHPLDCACCFCCADECDCSICQDYGRMNDIFDDEEMHDEQDVGLFDGCECDDCALYWNAP